MKFVSDLRQVGFIFKVLRFPPPINLTATINWNIVEHGVNHYKPNQTNQTESLIILESHETVVYMLPLKYAILDIIA